MKLRTWRKQNKWSVSQVADMIGVGVSTITAYENGSRRPRPETAHQIEIVSNGAVSASELLGLRTDRAKTLKEDPATFDLATRRQARELGLDPDAIAKKAVEDAVKHKRIESWIEENREAMEANAKEIRENGLWSDGRRLF